MNITANELLDALTLAMEKLSPEDAPTLGELAEAKGYHSTNQRPVRDAVQRLLDSGEWVCVKVMRQRMNGVRASTWGYRPKLKE